MHFILRLLINAAALWVAIELVPGITFEGDWRLLFVVALIFGVLNTLVRPILFVLSLPLLILTLGLFILVLNALMLWMTGYVSDLFGLGFDVQGFWPALLGSLIVTIVSFALSLFVGRSRIRHRGPRRARLR